MSYKLTSKFPVFFSFCIYGTKLIYYEGMIKNLELISKITPLPNVLIGYSDDILEQYKSKYESYDFVKMILIDKEFCESIMCSRLFQIDTIIEPAYVFCRDADSRVSERDVWCMQQFINTGRKVHIIRDHFYHKQKLQGGTCGFFLDVPSTFTKMFRETKLANGFDNLNKSYGLDEYFLSNKMYKLFNKDEMFIQTNCVGLLGETINTIDIKQTNDTDFIGNVYNPDDTAHFTYSEYINYNHLEWLGAQHQWSLILYNRASSNLEQNKWDKLHFLLNAATKAKDLNVCLELCNEFEYVLIDECAIFKSNVVLELARELKYEIVATSDISRKPEKNEFVICYGQYPHCIECLPTKSRLLHRHPLYYSKNIHTNTEYNKCWEPISTIYILNLEERRDRYLNLLVELCRIHAPLNRIFHYKAQKTSYTGNRAQDIYIGASNNHLDVVRHFIKSGNNHSLILEDDITFISDTTQIYKSIADFFKEPIEYDIAFLAYSKYGPFKKYNDLLSLSYQPCTTSSAYLLNKATSRLIENCLDIGVSKMKENHSPSVYCCDRYWACIQHRNKMFLFKRKLAFQTITHSDITNNVNYCFD